MERESFEDPELAKLLNEHFISIKIDREERPDIDFIFQILILIDRLKGQTKCLTLFGCVDLGCVDFGCLCFLDM